MKKNVSFKINKSAFFDGFTSFSLFPKYEKPASTVVFNPWKKVQESFRVVLQDSLISSVKIKKN